MSNILAAQRLFLRRTEETSRRLGASKSGSTPNLLW